MVKGGRTGLENDRWNEDREERTMLGYATKHGTGNWTTFSKRSAMRRSVKSSKQKWNDKQKADPGHKSFTPQEEELVIQLHAAIGSRWPIIAQQIPGKTDNDVKMLWNSKLRKKLSAMGIDPVTHRPFSQILADYGNIGAFPKARTRFTTLSRDLKNNMIMLNSEQPAVSNSNNHHHHSSLDLYSQLQAVNLVTEAKNYENKTQHDHLMTPRECASTSSNSLNEEIMSFSWSDFLLEDASLPSTVEELHHHKGMFLQSVGAGEDKSSTSDAVLDMNSFETASSSSRGSSFVEAMIERQDELMFFQLPGFCEDPFYY